MKMLKAFFLKLKKAFADAKAEHDLWTKFRE